LSEEKEDGRSLLGNYAGQRMPPLSDADIQKNAYRERREREKKAYLIAKETLWAIYERNRLAKEGYLDIQKTDGKNEYDVNDLVRKILKGKY